MAGYSSNAKAATDLDRMIGSKVNELRLNKGISRQELARQIGVTHQQLQKYVKGTNRITASRLVDIARILDTPIMYFFENSNEQEALNKILLEQECINVMKDFSQINSSTHRQTILNLISVFLQDEVASTA
jgi:transcriptional regulator with XRE-family HTH domain